MPNYQNGKIYKIIDLVANKQYIGSTTIGLSQRLAQHVSSYKSYTNGKGHFVTSFLIIENDNYDIVLIEKCACNSKEELHVRESHYSQSMDCVNKVKNQGLKNLIGEKAYKHQHYEQNKLDISLKGKQYRAINDKSIKSKKNEKHVCDCGSNYTQSNKSQHCRSQHHQDYIQININK
jgi:hypothetical protein